MKFPHVASPHRRKKSLNHNLKSRRLIFESLEARTVFATGGLVSPDPFFNQNPSAYPSFPNTDIPILHSNPGAGAVIYLGLQGGIASNGDYFPPSDFETKGTSTTSLTVSLGSKTIVTQAGLSFQTGHRIHINSDANNKNFMNAIVTSYTGTSLVVDVDSLNGSGTATAWTITNTHLTIDEREQVIDLWRQFAGQFAIFNIDVTTDPVDLATKPSTYVGLRSYGNGGVGLNSFTSPPSPGATLFTTDVPRYATTIGPHEVGHTFDLRHQANFNTVGLVSAEYGTAFSPIYFPIMGNRTDGNVEAHMMKWIYGQGWDSISVAQDDIATFAATLTSKGVSPFRTTEMDQSPDYGGTIAAAIPLTSLGNNAFAHNGIISTMTDVDMFSFTPTTSGYYSITLGRNGSTADFALKIFDAAGNLLASEDGDATIAPTRNVYDQHITRFFTAGTTYYLSAASHGNYADMGQYIMRASFVGDSTKPWRAEDVGFVGVPGYSHFNSSTNTYSIAGAGADFGMDFNLYNGFQMLTQQLQGDGQITVQMTSVDGPNEWSLGGIMIRSNVEGDDSQYVALAMTKEHGYVRYADDGTNNRTGPIFQSAGPKIGFTSRYLRITRVGNTFTFSHSTNGTSFSTIGSPITLTMNASVVNIGLFSTGTGNANNPALAGAPMNNSLQQQRLAISTFANVNIVATGSGVLNPNPFSNQNNFISPVLTANSSTTNSISISWNQALALGDTNGDGLVNIIDFNNVKNNFGGSGLGDTNYDGVINIVDYNNVKNNFGAPGGGATGYILERSEDGVNYTVVDSNLSASTLTYTDNNGLHDFERYYYRVRAKKADGSVSAPSNVISSVTRAGAVTNIHPSTTSTSVIVLRWDDVDGDAGYRVWRSTSESGTYTQVGGTLSANQTLRQDTGRTTNLTYWYKIETLDASGSSVMSEAFPIDTRWTLSSIANFTPSNITSSSVVLNWQDFSSGGNPAVRYVIYRGVQANGTQYYGETPIATTTLSEFSDSGLDPGTRYFYRIFAVNADGRLSTPRAETVDTLSAAPPPAEAPAVGSLLTATAPQAPQTTQTSTTSVASSSQPASDSQTSFQQRDAHLIGAVSANLAQTLNSVLLSARNRVSDPVTQLSQASKPSRAQVTAIANEVFALDYGKFTNSLVETITEAAKMKKDRPSFSLVEFSKL